MQYFKQDKQKEELNPKNKSVSSKEENQEENSTYDNDINHSNIFVLRNLKWDIIFAEDIFFILKSFLPENGSISKVEIYPSL